LTKVSYLIYILQLILIEAVDESVAEVEKLTKQDVWNYFQEHISPASPNRAKISVYMRAHPKPVDDNEGSTDGDASELDKLTKALCKMLKGQGLPADPKKLKARLEEDIPDLLVESEDKKVIVDPESIVEALETYLVEDEGVDEDKVDELEETGQTIGAVSGVLKRLGLVDEIEEVKEEDGGPKEHYALSKIKPTTIRDEDVLAFKSGMQATSGTWGFKDVKVYEDVEPKL